MATTRRSRQRTYRTVSDRSKVTRFVRLPEAMHLCGLSRSSIYQKMTDGSFPARIRISARSVAWLESDLIAWIEAQC